jgi:hypothetical protein
MNRFKKLQWFSKMFLFAFAAGALLVSCEKDEEETPPPPEDKDRTSGFVISGNTSSGSALVKYFEELPTGTVDLSDGQDFNTYIGRDAYNHMIYSGRIDGSFGISQLAVNQAGEVYEKAFIPTTDFVSRLGIRDENTAVFQEVSSLNTLAIYDPTTMEVTGNIDVSAAPEPVEDEESRYMRLLFRGDDVFCVARPSSGGNYSGFFLHRADVATASYAGETSRPEPFSGGIATNYNFGQQNIDDNGDMYISDGGSIGTGYYARIHRIAAGTNELDASYDFQPGAILAPENVYLPEMYGFRLIGNGKAIAKLNKEVPQEVVDIILALPGDTFEEKLFALLNDPETFNTVLGLLYGSETAVWCELDLNAKTVVEISGAPATAALSVAMSFEHDGDYYFAVASTSEVAYYKYTPGTATATKAFDVTGADLSNCINIANNN